MIHNDMISKNDTQKKWIFDTLNIIFIVQVLINANIYRNYLLHNHIDLSMV